MTVSREMMSGCIRRFGGWTPLRAAVAAGLGCHVEDVIDLEQPGAPVAYISARTQHGDFAIAIELFVDATRAPGFSGTTPLLRGLARSLGEEILYDDGGSHNPYRWVLVQPNGARYEVFERTGVDGPEILLDPDYPPRRLPDGEPVTRPGAHHQPARATGTERLGMALRTVRAVIDEQGNVRLEESVSLPGPRQALVTILDDAPAAPRTEVAQSLPPAGAAGEVRAAAGRTWKARFDPVRRIGRGGMGETFLAFDRESGTSVCVKTLLSGVDAEALAQECKALGKLRHAGIAKLLHSDATADPPYLVTEFVDGPTLATYLQRHGALPEPAVVDFAIRLFTALEYAHERDVLHCDLKPANILVEHDGRVLQPRIVDFGIAVVDRFDASGAITAEGRFAGTPQYMAKEQFEGAVLGAASDIYSAGQIVWEVLTGVPAFTGRLHEIAQRKAQATTGLQMPVTPWPVSDGLAQVIERCTRVAPAQRPPAEQVLRALRPLLSVDGHPSVPMPSNPRFVERAAPAPVPGWFDGVGCVGGISTRYEAATIDAWGPGTGGAARLRSRDATAAEFGTLMQRIPAAALVGREVLLSAELATQGVQGWAGLWLRVDGDEAELSFQNTAHEPLAGDRPPARLELRAAIGQGARWLNYGVILSGTGSVVARDVALVLQGGDGRTVRYEVWDRSLEAAEMQQLT